MNQSEYESKYRATLLAIEEIVESAIDEVDANIDFETANDILTLEFDNGSCIIITKQGPTQQLWVAAVSGGFHFEFDESSQQWLCTINNKSLSEMLSLACQEQGKVQIEFNDI